MRASHTISTSTRRRLAAISTAVVVVVAGACGDDDDSSAPSASAVSSSGSASPAAAGSVTVELADTSAGEALTSGGMTLYIFTPDNAGAPTCVDSCAATWPALLADAGADGGAVAGPGVDADKLGTVTGADGGEHVTYAGWPLYFYVGDSQPGDVNGQGVGGMWFVIDADGRTNTPAPGPYGG